MANLVLLAIFVAWLWHRSIETGFFGFFVALVLGFVPCLLVTLIVAMFLRTSDELRSWWEFGLASFVGWLVLLFLAKFLMPAM
jgi:chromate transport protein ChrA